MGVTCGKGSPCAELAEAEHTVRSLVGVDVLPGLSFPPSFNHLSRLAYGLHIKYYDALKDFVMPEVELHKWSTGHLVGKPRTPENWKNVHDKMMSYMEIPKQTFVPGYRHFPVDFSYGDVSMLATHNSFIASFLSMKEKNGKKTLCISSLPENGQAKSFLQKFTQALDHQRYRRFTVWFDDDMKVTSSDFFEPSAGQWVPVVIESEKEQLGQIVGTLAYVFECIHAALHIFECFITAAMFQASCGSIELSYFVEPLMYNVFLRMDEVIAFLIGPGAILSTFAGAKRGVMLETMIELIKCLGHIKDEADFMNNFIFASVPAEERIRKKLLPDFVAQAALVPGYATAVQKNMESNRWIGEKGVEQSVSSFLASCGDGFFGIIALNQWIQVQSLVGLMHGNTLSMTRTLLIEEYLGMVVPVDNFDHLAITTITKSFGTIVEIYKDHCVFQPEHSCLDEGVTRIMREWLAKSEDLKKAAQAKFSADESLMKSYGWIVTDYFPDMYDHKQLTITTYV